jgi:hypothetical protein
MKRLGILTVAVLAAGYAQADFFVNFAVPYGVADRSGDAVELIDANSGQSLLELYYVGDNGVVDYSQAPAAGTLGDVLVGGGNGDDVLLGSFIFTASGGSYDGFISGASQNIISSPYLGTGEIFGRVFQGTGAVGDWYYQGAVQVVADLDPNGDPPPTPADYFVDGGVAGARAEMGQVIPEPATFGLMGVAAMGLFLARKKARR